MKGGVGGMQFGGGKKSSTSHQKSEEVFFLLYRQSRYTYWYNDLYSMSAEAFLIETPMKGMGQGFLCASRFLEGEEEMGRGGAFWGMCFVFFFFQPAQKKRKRKRKIHHCPGLDVKFHPGGPFVALPLTL